MIVAIYSRKSTEQDATEENRSVARQEALCRAVAAGRGWPVEHVYVDDWVSGAEFERRPGLVRLLNNLKPRPSFGALLVYDKDRIGREQFETAYILKQLSVAGITIVECKGGVGREIALDTPMDKFLLAATSFAAELERDKARQRTADALLTKARAGHVTGGRLFGYDNVDVRSAEGHRERVERRINETEAQVVRSIFERYASGAGLRAIAHALNAEGAPAPKPRRNGRLKGWAPSSVREALHRETYRGQILYNRTRKRDRWGRKHQERRKAAEVVRVDAPALRIVSEELWARVHERLGGVRAQYAESTHGKLFGRPPSGVESKFLLTGFAVCGSCGGSLCARSRSHGQSRRYFYGCTVFERKGPSVCSNALALPLATADEALLEALEEELLDPLVIKRTIEKAMAELERGDDGSSPRADALGRELATIEAQLGRLTRAVMIGGDLERLVAQMRKLEARKTEIVAEQASAARMTDRISLAGADVLRLVEAAVKDYRGVLARQTSEARTILRELLVDRVIYTPTARRFCEFRAEVTLGRLLRGTLDPNGGGPNGIRSV